MANSEHLAILKEGVAVWNRWRRDHADILPDLTGARLDGRNLHRVNVGGADLRGADLKHADLREAYLGGANLSGVNFQKAQMTEAGLADANLSEANLNKANLRGAYLKGAWLMGSYLKCANLLGVDFSEANLSGANLTDADLSLADLSGVNLKSTNLSGANMLGANLQNAIIGATVFANIDLSAVRSLSKAKHAGPSVIGIDTLFRSQGMIPEVFLRGCGAPDQIIEFARSLLGKPNDYQACFIRCAAQDKEFAKRLHADLQENNVRCWYAFEDITTGDVHGTGIDEFVQITNKIILILSSYSVRSDWAGQEVEHALHPDDGKHDGALFPIRLDEAIMDCSAGWAAKVRHQYHIADFSGWRDGKTYADAMAHLLRDLKMK
ncbi:MAG: toll/interleukin-1 receptor domain-containing protein [Chlorobiaceae bacterium]|nr:toll/interleukin-1 receptor domain-containing protein [Chlorobiaceae bacterium]